MSWRSPLCLFDPEDPARVAIEHQLLCLIGDMGELDATAQNYAEKFGFGFVIAFAPFNTSPGPRRRYSPALFSPSSFSMDTTSS